MGVIVNRFDDWEVSQGYPTIDLRNNSELNAPSGYSAGHFSAAGLQRVTQAIAKMFARCQKAKR